jgi:hypothetical protein
MSTWRGLPLGPVMVNRILGDVQLRGQLCVLHQHGGEYFKSEFDGERHLGLDISSLAFSRLLAIRCSVSDSL